MTDKPVTDVHTEEELKQAKGMVEMMNEYAASFDVLCTERHAMGQEEYGAFTFLENDVIRMMIEELADTVNYCRMQAVKLMMLQAALEDKLEDSPLVNDEQQITLGVQAFRGTGSIGWGDKQ